ncbi:MAG: Mor transcription activator family protein [Marinobacter sp.]|uniref:Mor transcription activator family protein n=1 Tax=Marinobacter sp. TaxID=50741 RepID=UPI00299DE11E|nr:Mor transcription activator family protein [Marinobacter sp.]MDX1755866.1 Mor transcription activator family protein [Marinobacter sp.]
MALLLDTKYLPPTVSELVDVIGLVAALQLVECVGGTRIWVPQTVTQDHPLVKWIGQDAAEALADHVCGGELGVPRCADALRAARNTAICESRSKGVTVGRLALECGLTERQVFSILASAREADERQQDMFA